MRDKTAGKMPNFFNNNSSFSQKADKEPLIIMGSELPDLLNAPLDRDKKYHLLISFIHEHDAEYLNQKITVNSHITDEKEGHTPPHWTTTATKRVYGNPGPTTQDEPLMTTLANIIATNELNFSSTQMVSLFKELMAKRVDFSTIDQSPYLNLIHPKSGNNPLKSLIVSSFGDPELIELVGDFISYIESNIAGEERLFMINNLDNFEYEAMRPAEFLLRLGHEDLALRLYNLGAKPTSLAFQLACASFGTTLHYEEAIRCIHFLMKSVDLDESVLLEGKTSLYKASPAQYTEMLTRISQMLYEESKLKSGHATIFEMIRKEYLEHYQDTMSLSFHDFCQNKTNREHPLIQKYALLRIKEENVGNGLFSAYYRTDPDCLATKKWTLLKHNQKANKLLLDLIELIDNQLETTPTLSLS
ncbi:TPA: hypothetical protein ACPSKY_003643 [Legionella bozemanae]